jgi:DivIVA domain-containing protein
LETAVPLSPQDVRNKLFTPVRFKPGYDEDEVDAFLDEVEAELTRLAGEIDQLQSAGHSSSGDAEGADRGDVQAQLEAVRAEADARARANLQEVERRYAEQLAALRAESDAQLASMQSAPRTDQDVPLPATGPDDDEVELRVAEARRAGQAELQQQLLELAGQLQQAQGQLQLANQRATAAAGEVERLRAEQVSAPITPSVSGVSEETIRRTLVLAQRTADEAVSEAREEAASIVSSARNDAEETARTAAAEHAAVTRQREADHAAALSRGRAEHDLLVGKLEELRSFERDYRSRLRAYLHLQLRDLEAGAPEPSAAVSARRTAAIGGANGVTPSSDEDTSLELQPAEPAATGHTDEVDETDDPDTGTQPAVRGGWFGAPEPVEKAR